MKKQVIGVDLFAGAGGLSLGAEMAGITVKYAIEIDPFAAETYKTNHPLTLVINDDIRRVSHLSCDFSENQLVLFGGAPCQGSLLRTDEQTLVATQTIGYIRNLFAWFIFLIHSG